MIRLTSTNPSHLELLCRIHLQQTVRQVMIRMVDKLTWLSCFSRHNLALCASAVPLVTALGAFAPSLSLLQVLVLHEAATALSATADPLTSNLLARALTLLELALVSLAGTLGTTAEPFITDLLARALSLFKSVLIALNDGGLVTLVVALLAGADPFVADLLAGALALLEGGLVALVVALGTGAEPLITDLFA